MTDVHLALGDRPTRDPARPVVGHAVNGVVLSGGRASWSPDSERIAVSVYHQPANGYAVFAYDVAAVTLVPVATNDRHSLVEPTYSPTGQLAVVGYNPRRAEEQTVYVTTPGTDNLTPITDIIGAHHPAWTPDGRNIVFVSDNRLYHTDADTPDATREIALPCWAATAQYPVVHPDGDSLLLAVFDTRVNGYRLVRLGLDGTDVSVVTSLPDAVRAAYWMASR